MIVGLFLLAYMYNHNIVFLMMFAAFSLAMGASFIGRRNLYDLELKLATQPRLFAHEPLQIPFELINPANYERYAVYIAQEAIESGRVTIKANSSERVYLEYKELTRGEYSFESLMIHSFFPFGHELFHTKRSVDESVLVYPQAKGKKLEEHFFNANSLSGERDDFDHLRTYDAKDSMSVIYWPSVAKGEMLSKEFIYEKESHFFALEYEKAGSNHEERLSQLCLWVLECEAKEAPFSVKIDDKVLDSKRGIDVILATLARS